MSRPYRHIAACVAQSGYVDVVLGEAERLSGLGPGCLSVVHVVDPPAWGIEPQRNLVESLEGAREWLQVTTARLPGATSVLLEAPHPGVAVCRWCEAHDVDLIVASAHRSLADRVVLGSFAGYIAYHAPCAVHLVRPRKA